MDYTGTIVAMEGAIESKLVCFRVDLDAPRDWMPVWCSLDYLNSILAVRGSLDNIIGQRASFEGGGLRPAIIFEDGINPGSHRSLVRMCRVTAVQPYEEKIIIDYDPTAACDYCRSQGIKVCDCTDRTAPPHTPGLDP